MSASLFTPERPSLCWDFQSTLVIVCYQTCHSSSTAIREITAVDAGISSTEKLILELLFVDCRHLSAQFNEIINRN